MTETFYRWHNDALLLELQIQARASRDGIIGEHHGHLKIAIKAVPEDGKANAHVIKFLAKHFGVPQNRVEIIKGHKNKYKSVMILEPKENLENFRKPCTQ